MSKSGGVSPATRKNASITDRLHAVMEAHDLGLEEFADMLRTHPQTLALWLEGELMAPACSLITLPLLGRMPQARAYPSDSKEEALRRVQAI